MRFQIMQTGRRFVLIVFTAICVGQTANADDTELPMFDYITPVVTSPMAAEAMDTLEKLQGKAVQIVLENAAGKIELYHGFVLTDVHVPPEGEGPRRVELSVPCKTLRNSDRDLVRQYLEAIHGRKLTDDDQDRKLLKEALLDRQYLEQDGDRERLYSKMPFRHTKNRFKVLRISRLQLGDGPPVVTPFEFKAKRQDSATDLVQSNVAGSPSAWCIEYGPKGSTVKYRTRITNLEWKKWYGKQITIAHHPIKVSVNPAGWSIDPEDNSHIRAVTFQVSYSNGTRWTGFYRLNETGIPISGRFHPTTKDSFTVVDFVDPDRIAELVSQKKDIERSATMEHARKQLNHGEGPAALRTLAYVRALNPSNSKALLVRAFILMGPGQKKWIAALQDLSDYLVEQPGDAYGELLAGIAFMNVRRLKKSIQFLGYYLKKHPNDANVFLLRARCHFSNRNYTKASHDAWAAKSFSKPGTEINRDGNDLYWRALGIEIYGEPKEIPKWAPDGTTFSDWTYSEKDPKRHSELIKEITK